jgi:hypothetical protein
MPDIVNLAALYVRDLEADAIVACGHSGLVGAGALSYITGVPVFAVRKKGEPTVADSPPVSAIAPNGKAKRWVWFDDFIGSGGTLRRSVRELWEAELIATPCPAALMLYGEYPSVHQKFVGERGRWQDSSVYLSEEFPDFDWDSVPNTVLTLGLKP